MKSLTKQYPLLTGVNHPGLRKKSLSVAKITKEIKQFADDLLELMEIYEGVGLAAPQV